MFCCECGTQIAIDNKFCPNCGAANPNISAETTDKNEGKTYTITIERKNQWFAINPAIKVIVDQMANYEVKNGESINIPMTPGQHNIAFSCSVRNKIVNINVMRDSVLKIKFNRLTGSIEVQ